MTDAQRWWNDSSLSERALNRLLEVRFDYETFL